VQKLAVGESGCPHDLQKLDPKAGAGITCAWIIACRCLSFLATASATTIAIKMGGMISVISSGRLKTLAVIVPGLLMVWVAVEGMP